MWCATFYPFPSFKGYTLKFGNGCTLMGMWSFVNTGINVNQRKHRVPGDAVLTHWGRPVHICVSDLGRFTQIMAWHYTYGLYYGGAIIWNTAGLLLTGLKWQFNLRQTTTIFIKGNSFEKVVCKIASMLSRPWHVELRYDENYIW